MTLEPCSGCARHVRDDEARCPFCGAALRSRRAPRRGHVAHLPRAALLAAPALALGIAAAACGGAQREPSATIYGGPPVPAEDGGVAPPDGSSTNSPPRAAAPAK